ncbi:MAG: VIT and vWA domain-containing protein, partial [Desulforhopalus sp.]
SQYLQYRGDISSGNSINEVITMRKHKSIAQNIHPLSMLGFFTIVCLLATFFTSTARAAGLLVADGGFGGRLEIVEHDVRVTINNNIAVTHVTQIFKNLEQRQVEALYTFPVPKDASVSNFSMWINGKEMIGEVLEKQRARQIYNSYKQKRRDPGLLEQNDYKSFEMRIFPIAAGARQKVQVTYYQELEFDHDQATYVYPLATTSKGRLDSKVKGKFAVAVDVKSVIPIIAMTSPSHDKDFLIVDHNESFYEASLENRDGDLARDIVLSFQSKRAVSGMDLVASNRPGEDGFFQMTLTAGDELKKSNQGGDYVFILDVSGSMSNDGKLTASRSSIDSFITTLEDNDRFEVITFNRQIQTVFNTLTTAGDSARKKAISFLSTVDAKGGTFLQPALTAAYRYNDPDRTLNVVILSDGMTEQSERNLLMELIRSRPSNVRVFCIGVGNEINRPLLKQMAEDAGGLAAFISKGDNFARQAQAFRRKLTHPVAANLRLEVSGIDIYDIEPKKLPNLFHGMPIRIYGRYKNGGVGQVILSADIQGRPIQSTAELKFPDSDDSNPEIERMWAYHKMRNIQDNMVSASDQPKIDEIVRLGEAFSITSEYTSFIVLENDSEYKRWNIERRNALRINRDRQSQQKIRNDLDKLRMKIAADIGPNTDSGGAAPINSQQMVQASKPLVVQQQKAAPIAQKPRNPSRSFDMPNFGGGALDPISATLAISMAGAGIAGYRRKRSARK